VIVVFSFVFTLVLPTVFFFACCFVCLVFLRNNWRFSDIQVTAEIYHIKRAVELIDLRFNYIKCEEISPNADFLDSIQYTRSDTGQSLYRPL